MSFQMRRRAAAIGSLLLMGAMLLLPTTADGATIFDVGAGRTYGTVQEAIAALPTTAWTDDYVIDIYSGDYSPGTNTINYNTNGNLLTIQAHAGETVNLNINSYGAFDVYSGNLIVQGLNAVGSGGDNRLLHVRSGAGNIQVLNNTLSGSNSQILLFLGNNDNVSIIGNTFTGNGGGGAAGVVHFWNNGGGSQNLEIAYNTIHDNFNTGAYGLVHVMDADTAVYVHHNLLYNNSSGHGLIVTGADGDCYISNNTIDGLTLNSNAGIYAAGDVKVYNNIVTNTTFVGINNAGGATVDYNDVWNNVTDFAGSHGANNISEIPDFINASGGDYRISNTSQCVDAGTTDVPAGYPGYNGLSYDMGYYETVPEPATMALLGLGGIGLLVRRRK